jgi:hypothetical protein
MLTAGRRPTRRFGLDEGGEIYLLTKQDGVVRKRARSVETESTILPVERPPGTLNK